MHPSQLFQQLWPLLQTNSAISADDSCYSDFSLEKQYEKGSHLSAFFAYLPILPGVSHFQSVTRSQPQRKLVVLGSVYRFSDTHTADINTFVRRPARAVFALHRVHARPADSRYRLSTQN